MSEAGADRTPVPSAPGGAPRGAVAAGSDSERPSRNPVVQIGRYVLFDEIASGGFASIHLARTIGVAGFSRVVAVKRLHRQFARDPEVSAMFLDEAKVVARIRHPNVVPTLDLIAEDDELFLVMEYVEGVTLKHLMRHARRRQRTVPLGVVLRIMVGALQGLHAAHEARDERGELLQLIHRDISPDNILVGIDGMPRLLDFGVARALGQFHSTRDGEVKGKLAYISPEQVRGEPITRRTDIFSASAVFWEAMTGRRLFKAKTIGAMAHAVLNQRIDPPSALADTPKKLDGIIMQGLERDAERRWASAAKMAAAMEAVGEVASQHAVGRYVRQAGADRLAERAREIALVEAFPLENLKPLPIRSRLDSLHVDSTREATPRSRAPARSKPPPPPKRRSAPPPAADARNSEEVPALAQQPLLRRKGVVPLAAGALGVVGLLGLVAIVGSGEDPPATTEGSPARQQVEAPRPAPQPAPPATTSLPEPEEAKSAETAAAPPQPPPPPKAAPAAPPPRPAPQPVAIKPPPQPAAPKPAPRGGKSDREKLWGRN